MDWKARKILAEKPIIWTGDLNDDCTAIWAGLILRAEEMDHGIWWWRVSQWDTNKIPEDLLEIDSSNAHDKIYKSGQEARNMAERIAKDYVRI